MTILNKGIVKAKTYAVGNEGMVNGTIASAAKVSMSSQNII